MNAGQQISSGRPYEITIQKFAPPEPDESGFEPDDEDSKWVPFYTNYAYCNSLYGNERWKAAQVSSDRTIRFSLRWHPQLDEVKPKYYRLIFAGKPYTITYVDNVQYRNETVMIDAVEVEA